jgi:acetyltransferase
MQPPFVEFDLRLRDGRRVRLRAITPADEAALLAAFERLSPEDKYRRFMRVMGAPNLERLRQALSSFPEAGMGLAAVTAEGRIAGSASFMIGSDPTTAEFATTVDADFAGQGLGGALLGALIEAGRRRGLRRLEGYVLANNPPMLRLAARQGFTIRPDPDDRSVHICSLELAGS